MNVLDIVLLGILTLCLIWGAIRGLLWQLATLAMLIAGFVLATRYCTVLGSWLAEFLNVSNLALLYMVSFILIFLVPAVGCYFLAKLFKQGLKKAKLGFTDHLLGGFLGLLKGLVLCWALLLVSVNLPGSKLEQQAQASLVGPRLVSAMDLMRRMLPKELRTNGQRFLRQWRSQPDEVPEEPEQPQEPPSSEVSA